jgi:hypothetical protein
VRIGSVELAGAFRPEEREFLAAQFGSCRLELLARSVRDERVALVAWRPTAPLVSRGPRPLFGAPGQATYVLDGSAGAASAAGPGAGLTLARVDSTGELNARYPGHFPGVRIKTAWRERLRRLWHGATPAVILALAVLWAALLWWFWQALPHTLLPAAHVISSG